MATTFVRLVKSASATTAATSIALTSLAANVPVGDTLVICLDSNVASATAVTASDNSSQSGSANTYTTRLDSTTGGTAVRVVVLVCQVTRQIQTTDTITIVTPSGEYSVRVLQFTGSSGFDAASTTNVGSGTAVTTNSATTVASSGMLVAAVASRQIASGSDTVGTIGGGTATTGSTTLEGQLWNGGTSNSLGAAIAEEYAAFTAGGTAHATFTLPTTYTYAAGILSLADAAAAGPDPSLLALPQVPPQAAYPRRIDAPRPLADVTALLPAGAPLPPRALTMLGALPGGFILVSRSIGPFTLEALSPVFMPTPPPTPPDPSLSTLGQLAAVLRGEMRAQRFTGPYALDPLAAIFLPAPAPPPSPALTMLGALPQIHRVRPAPFIGPFPLRDVAQLFPPGPPLPFAALSALGLLPLAYRLLPTPRFLHPYRVPDGVALFIPPPGTPAITTTSLPAATISVAYSTTLAASGGTSPYTWSITSGSLPTGLTLHAGTGVIDGTPTVAGASTFTVRVTDHVGRTASVAFSIVVWALSYAEIGLTTQPAITAVLRAKRGLAARLDPTSLYTNALTDVACAVAYPANGNIVRAHLSGGNVQTQSLAASGGSAWTTWTTLAAATAPPAGFGVALAALGHTVALAFIDSVTNTTVHVYRSTNDGSSWSSLYSIANTGVVTDLALAYDGSGNLLLVTGDNGGTIRAYLNGGSAVSLVPPSSAFIGSIALVNVGVNFYALFGWQNATLDYLGSAFFGGGAWSAVTDVLGIAPGNAATPQVCGFAWGADGGHAILVEQYAILGGYNANPCYLMECSSTTAFIGGYWTEPAPFPYNGGLSGCDIAASQVSGAGSTYAAAGENLVELLAPPADLDVSARVISFVQHDAQHAGSLAIGYATPGGTFTVPLAQRFIVRAESSWVASRHIVTLTAHDGWQLLHQLVARRQAQFGTALGLPTKTVDQIVHWLCAKAGVEYTAPANTTLNQRTPNWTVLPNHNLGLTMLDLLDTIESWLLMTPTGATVIPLAAGDTSIYSYGGAGQHPVLQVFHTLELSPANLITVYTGTAGVLPLVIGAQSFDTPDAHLLGVVPHAHDDLQLESANAQATAGALLRKAQISTPLHSLSHPPQPTQQLGDVVTVTDPLTLVAYTGRVQVQTVHYDRDRSLWLHQTTLSAV